MHHLDITRLVEYMLNPSDKMRICEVISDVSLARSPPTPALHVESCKIVSFRRGGYQKQVNRHNLDSRGYRG